MNRRKFLDSSGTALVGITALKGARLFGTPASLGTTAISLNEMDPHLLKLHLTIEGISEEGFPRWEALAQLADDIIASPGHAKAFTDDPQTFLGAAGFSGANIDTNSLEFKMVLALADPSVRTAVTNGDAVAFLQALQPLGFDTGSPVSISPDQCGSDACTYAYALAYVYIATDIAVSIVTLVFAAVIIVVAGARTDTPVVSQMAAAMGGKTFANDVVKTVAYNQAELVFQAIRDGRISTPQNQSPEQYIDAIKAGLARHLP